KLTIWHRLTIGAMAGLVIVLSIAAGLLSREGAAAPSQRPREGVIGGGAGGGSGGGPGGGAGGVGGKEGKQRLELAPETAIEFKNSAKAPLIIIDAKVKSVLRAPDAPGDESAVIPLVTVANNTEHRVKFFTLEFRNGLERRAYSERATIEPHTT